MIETITAQAGTNSQPLASFIRDGNIQSFPLLQLSTNTAPSQVSTEPIPTIDLNRITNSVSLNFDPNNLSEPLPTHQQSQEQRVETYSVPQESSSTLKSENQVLGDITKSNLDAKDSFMFSSDNQTSLFHFPAPGNTIFEDTCGTEELGHRSNLTGHFRPIASDDDHDKLLSEFDSNLSMKTMNSILLPESGIVYSRSSSLIELEKNQKNGEDHKLQRSKSEDHTFMRPQNRNDDILYRPRSRNEDPVSGKWRSHISDELLSKTESGGIFRNPNLGTSPVRTKRKHRPAPLIIPPYVSNSGFQSRLRSPRIRDGNEVRTVSPPPYTPPPMLSPVRSGPGLFCNIPTPYRSASPRLTPSMTARMPIMSRRSKYTFG